MFRYGLMNYDELTQKDVAKMMGNFTVIYFTIRKENNQKIT